MYDAPLDRTLKLAYADFLDEQHGDETPRSRAIRERMAMREAFAQGDYSLMRTPTP